MLQLPSSAHRADRPLSVLWTHGVNALVSRIELEYERACRGLGACHWCATGSTDHCCLIALPPLGAHPSRPFRSSLRRWCPCPCSFGRNGHLRAWGAYHCQLCRVAAMGALRRKLGICSDGRGCLHRHLLRCGQTHLPVMNRVPSNSSFMDSPQAQETDQ